MDSRVLCVRFQFTICGDLAAICGDTSWLNGERVRAPALDAYHAEANATYFLADQIRRRDATGSSGVRSRLSIAVVWRKKVYRNYGIANNAMLYTL